MRRAVRADAFDVVTPESGYWLGFLFADGCVDQARSRVSVHLTESDADHLAKLRDFLGSTHPIGHSPAYTYGRYTGRPSCRLSIGSKHLATAVLGHGRYDGPITTALTESADFWRGVVDGDGTVGSLSTGRFYFGVVGPRRVLDPFRTFLRAHGVPGRLNVTPTRSIFQVRCTTWVSAQVAELLYGHGGPALDRKAAAAQLQIDALREERVAEHVKASELRCRYESGADLVDLAAHYKTSTATVLRRLRQAGISRRPAVALTYPTRIRDQVDVAAVCAAYQAGESATAICCRLGVSERTLRRAVAEGGFVLRNGLARSA